MQETESRISQDGAIYIPCFQIFRLSFCSQQEQRGRYLKKVVLLFKLTIVDSCSCSYIVIIPSSLHTTIVTSQALTSRTAETLQQLHSALYCTTTYKDTYENFFAKKEKDSHHHRKRFSLVKTAVDLAVDYTDLADGEIYEEAEDAFTGEVQLTEDGNSSAKTDMVETTIEEDYLSDEAIAENGTLAYEFSSVYLDLFICRSTSAMQFLPFPISRYFG